MSLRGARIAVLLIAAVTGAAAIIIAAAPWLGLRAGEVSVAYAWFGLARRSLFFVFVSLRVGAVLESAVLWVFEAGRARASGVHTVDLWEDLVAVHKRSYEEYKGLWASFDRTNFGHMSGAGNRLVAERLARELRGLVK